MGVIKNGMETIFGGLIHLLLLAAALAGAYWCWPTGILDLPLQNLTLRHLLWCCGSLLLVYGSLLHISSVRLNFEQVQLVGDI